MTKWEDRSRWYRIKFRWTWKYKTALDRLYAFLAHDKSFTPSINGSIISGQ